VKICVNLRINRRSVLHGMFRVMELGNAREDKIQGSELPTFSLRRRPYSEVLRLTVRRFVPPPGIPELHRVVAAARCQTPTVRAEGQTHDDARVTTQSVQQLP